MTEQKQEERQEQEKQQGLKEQFDLIFHPGTPFGPVRISAGLVTQALALGPLAGLVGAWSGTGFNTIWRPNDSNAIINGGPNPNHSDHFLQLNLTTETLNFTAIPGPVPNRGLLQPDINLFGLHYLQQINSRGFRASNGVNVVPQAIHLEPGLWMNVIATSDPADPPGVVRIGSIPHGNAFLAQGTAVTTPGAPEIDPVSPAPGVNGITPFRPGFPNQPFPFPEQNLANDGPTSVSSSQPLDPGITQEMVDDPNSILRDDIVGQNIISTTTLSISTTRAGSGVENIPFLGTANPGNQFQPTEANAFVQQMTATFWLETVRARLRIPVPIPFPGGEPGSRPAGNGIAREVIDLIQPEWSPDSLTFLQLQYSQTVLLNFNGLL